MAKTKTETVSFRVTPEFKGALRRAALRERRSQANLLEVLVYEYCEKHSVAEQDAKPNVPAGKGR